MSANVVAAICALGAVLGVLATVRIVAAARRVTVHAALPHGLRISQALGTSLLPTLPRWWPALWLKPWFAATDRALRLGALAPQLGAAEWLRCLVGVAALTALLSAFSQLALPGHHTLGRYALAGVAAISIGTAVAQRWLLQRQRARESGLLRDTPVALELIALSLECGCALVAALELAARHLPAGPMCDMLRDLRADLAAGRGRSQALRRLFDRFQGSVIAPTLGALVQAEAAGSSLAPVLRAQGRQRTEERFAAAEKAALQAPVKMLLPLIVCIFPCTFIIIAFPLAMRFLK